MQPCQHNLLRRPARRKHISLMRRQVDLARQAFKLLGLQSHSGSLAGPAAGRLGDVPHLYRGSDWQQGQLRCASYAPSQVWERKTLEQRQKDENGRRQRNISSNHQALPQSGHPAGAGGAPNQSREAELRANQANAVEHSRDGHLHIAAQPLPASKQHPALHEVDLDSAPLCPLSSSKVKTAAFACQSTKMRMPLQTGTFASCANASCILCTSAA